MRSRWGGGAVAGREGAGVGQMLKLAASLSWHVEDAQTTKCMAEVSNLAEVPLARSGCLLRANSDPTARFPGCAAQGRMVPLAEVVRPRSKSRKSPLIRSALWDRPAIVARLRCVRTGRQATIRVIKLWARSLIRSMLLSSIANSVNGQAIRSPRPQLDGHRSWCCASARSRRCGQACSPRPSPACCDVGAAARPSAMRRS